MPHNNRMHTSASLKTHGVWKNVVKYDPYAAEGEDPTAAQARSEGAAATVDQFKGLMQLARLSGNTNHTKNRGACLKCGMMGHMTHMCRNFLNQGAGSGSDDSDSSDDDIPPPVDDGSGGGDHHGDARESEAKEKKRKKKSKKHKKESKRGRSEHKKKKKKKRKKKRARRD